MEERRHLCWFLKDDLQNGKERSTKKNGDIYEGEFRNGHVEGNVVIHYADGRRFKGVYRKGGAKEPALRKIRTASV